MIHQAINRRFGTWRGAIRTLISWPQHWLGQGQRQPGPDSEITRLVFVCRGNISRSAYAEHLGKQLGLNTASFGVSAGMGNPAEPVATKVGASLGVDLSAHRSTTLDGYKPQPGDLLLCMEVRQLEVLAAHPEKSHVPRVLLGSFAACPHIHDPFTLSEAYYQTCFARISKAVTRLSERHPKVRRPA
jgi:protein-tyrosine phosphatase